VEPSAPYPLIAAVQDLHDLWLRFAPSGPYRHELFHDQPEPEPEWPRLLRQRSPRLELLLRGAGCLLGNNLAPAALPVLRELLPGLQALEVALVGPPQAEVAAYYALLSRELEATDGGDAVARAYFLFGELLALYLDVLCLARPELRASLGVQTTALRRKLHAARAAASGRNGA
jgi:hypothetical protein